MKILALLPFLLLFQFGFSQSIKKIVIDEKDEISGYYLALEPAEQEIEGVLVLLPGFGQRAEAIFPETKLPNVAYANSILTIGFAEGTKLYADEEIQDKFTAVLSDVIERYSVSKEKFVLGGYSAGGTVALRYSELCLESPGRFPIVPKGVFMVDSPIDIFSIWEGLEENLKNNYSEIAVQEAEYAMGIIKESYGVPRDNLAIYAKMNPFSMNKVYGENEIHLKNIAVRAYHDVDISWRLKNRNQSVKDNNFFVTSELINRLLLLGNKEAEFIQTFRTGYRSDGQRHPHSWSIVDEVECITWIKKLLEK